MCVVCCIYVLLCGKLLVDLVVCGECIGYFVKCGLYGFFVFGDCDVFVCVCDVEVCVIVFVCEDW